MGIDSQDFSSRARPIAACAAAIVLALGCHIEDPRYLDGPGGAEGGAGGQGGGSGGHGGTGGEAGGPGGEGGAAGGSGGAGGDGGGNGGVTEPGWLSDPSIWTEIDLGEPPTAAKIYEGDPAGFQFPKLVWEEACGKGCSSLRFSFGDVTDDAVLGGVFASREDGDDAYLAISHWFRGTNRSIRRMVRLTDGVDVSAFSVVNPPTGDGITLRARWEDPALLALHRDESDDESTIWAVHGSEQGWDLKTPWVAFVGCHNFALSVEPPVSFFGCREGLYMMKERGSSAYSGFSMSEDTAVGDGAHGRAVWAQHLYDQAREFHSWIRVWEAGEPTNENVMRLPGDVCGLAVGRQHIAGFRGDSPPGERYCTGLLEGPRFFWIVDGDVTYGEELPAEKMLVSGIATVDDFTAAKILLGPETPFDERTRVILIRHSDGKMRQFLMPSGGHSMETTTVALDDDYLYYTLWNASPGNHTFDAVYRYRLDLFDEIGLPYPPESD